MKRLLAFAVVAAVIVGAASVYAGGACCPAGKDKKTEAKSDACADMMSKLNLTDGQKAKVTALKEESKKATSTSECYDMMSKGLEKILTADQLKQWNADCEKAKAGCGAMKEQAKTDDKK